MITYNTRLVATNPLDFEDLKQILVWNRLSFNNASKIQFTEPKKSIVSLHGKFYTKARKENPEIPSQVLIRAEQECLSAYRSVKSNKHKIKNPIEKKNLSIRLDKRLYSKNKKSKYLINITTSSGRKTFGFIVYDKLKNLLDSFDFCDPLIYLDNDKNLSISFTFDIKKELEKPKLVLGVDLGILRVAACSDGRIIIDKKFNKDKRQLRYLKRQLQSRGTKSARRHLRKIRHKEHNRNKNQAHLVANEILKTDANAIALENLKGIKAKKHKRQNKNAISQIPLFELRRILTYKAENSGKTVFLVNPYMTSQTDSLTGKIEGDRKGRRFYTKSGPILDADLSASRNIGSRSKHPVSYGNILDGQAVVTRLNSCKDTLREDVCKSILTASDCKLREYYKPPTLVGGM